MSQIRVIKPVRQWQGTIVAPGDKSISHRLVMLAGLADRPVRLSNFLYAADCLSTVRCMRALGVRVDKDSEGVLTVMGNGLYGLKEPEDVLDAGNSGTTLRLMTGILGAQPFFSVFTGDASLRQRPMGRVVKPLRQMGSQLLGRQDSRNIPLAIGPNPTLHGIRYDLPVASAQVKSAILLAGLFADAPTTISEPQRSRDHTERLLELFGVPVKREGNVVTIEPAQRLEAPPAIDIAGDISSAAFWMVAASIVPDSEVTIENVGLNPTRTGVLEVLQQMGADLTVMNRRISGNEEIADIFVRSAKLKACEIGEDIMPRLIDEIPILAVAAMFAEGTTVISGAEELRIKETDRLRAVALEFAKMGAVVREKPDGLEIEGGHALQAATCSAHHDHRIAMSLAIAGSAAQGVTIEGAECVEISYPDFYDVLARAAQQTRGGL